MSDEGEKTCPLCAEEMDITDQQLKPCKCGYEICVWCWHHIMDMAEKDDTEGRCPACRSAYDKEKIVGMAANCERMVADVGIERKKSQKAKTKPSEGRKQLSSVRVIQRNLVYIVGLPLTLADEELLQQREYFGQYGKVLKVSMSRTATGVIQQFPNSTCSVYITYGKEEEAVRCIQSVHGFVLDGRSLKACFGTTKYCHAWLRNVPCTNPDCLYLHEVGSQEDSFTKDEIISAYTRVQQITGATINLLRRAGSMLPPPVDDYNNSASAAKPIARSASSNTSTTGRSSPPNGSSGRSIGLPAAASWGMRASNLPPAVGQACSNGPSKPKLEAPSGSTIAVSAAVAGTTQASPLLSDATKRSGWFDESPIINSKGKSDAAKPVKRLVSMDGRSSILEKPASDNGLSAGLLSNRSSPITTKYNDWGNSASQSTSNSIHPAHGGTSTKEGTVARDGQVQNSGIDLSSVRLDTNVRNEISGISRTSSSLSEQSSVKSPSNQVLQQPFVEQYRDPLSTPATENNAARTNRTCTSGEHISLRLDLQSKKVADAASVAEEDVISFDNQRLKDPEIVSRSSYLQNSANPLHAHRHSRSRSLQHSEAFSPLNPNADSLYIDSRVGDSSPHHSSTNFALPNGYSRKPVSSTGGFDKNVEHSYLFSNDRDVKHIARPQADNDSNVSPDVGESSIISNILSLELDPWDDSLTSPHNFVKLLAESDKQSSTLKLSSSRKPQSSNQSRFSFARQEGPATNQAFDVDSSYSNFSQLHQNRSFSQDYIDSRNPYMDQLGTVNGFSSNFEEPGSFSSSLPAVSSNKPSMSRGQIPVPPGFAVPSRAPPPGFSSHERVEQNFELLSGNHLFDSSLPRNSYQAPSAGNISNSGDIEFIDPAILAVGKGRFQGGLNNQVLDMRANFPQQLSAFENEARLQLLMQRSLSPHQNLRYADAGDSFSSLSDSYGISSRLVDPPQVNNLAPFAQLSLQQSRNGLVSNGLWDGWNEVQGGNNIGMAELLRNERLGFNKFYGAAGYEDSKFRIATSGDLYNRTFEM